MNRLSEIKENFTIDGIGKCSVEELNFVYNNSLLKINEINEIFDLNTNKTYFLLGLCFTVFSTLGTYFIVNIDFNGQFNVLLLSALLLSLVCFSACVFLLRNIKSFNHELKGSTPSKLLHSWYYQENRESLKEMLFTGILHNEVAIQENKKHLRSRAKRNMITIRVLVISPIVVLFIHLILSFLLW